MVARLDPTMVLEDSDGDGALPLGNALGLGRVGSKNPYSRALLGNRDLGEADVFELDGNQDIGKALASEARPDIASSRRGLKVRPPKNL
jgi:hypothetical protein